METGYIYFLYYINNLNHLRLNILQQKKRKEDNIGKWRNMVNEVIKKQDEDENNIKAAVYLERHKDYYSLRPHLSKKTFSELCRARSFTLGSTISPPLKFILDDIDRLEKEWKLV